RRGSPARLSPRPCHWSKPTASPPIRTRRAVGKARSRNHISRKSAIRPFSFQRVLSLPDAQRQSPDVAIAAHNVTLTLGSDKAPVEILRGVDLEVDAGTSVALLGPSGSGKSSLMAVLAGLERANGGSINVAGLDFATMDEDDLARARRGRIGIVL